MTLDEIQKRVADQVADAYEAGRDQRDLIRDDLLADLERAKTRAVALQGTVEQHERTLRKVTGVGTADVEAMRDIALALGATEGAKPSDILEKLRDLLADSDALHEIRRGLNLSKGDTVGGQVQVLQAKAAKFENLKALMR